MPAPRILILGKLPPPYMGPSVATKILLQSSLKNHFEILHVDTKAFGSLNELGKWSLKKVLKNISIYGKMLTTCIAKRPALVLLPVSQATIGFLKDSVFVLIAWITFRRVLLQLRGSDFKRWYDSCGTVLKIYVRFILKRTNGVIVLGNNLRFIFADFFFNEKIFVCPNGGNYSIPKLPHDETSVHLLYLANLNRAKGIEDLLLAAKILYGKGIRNYSLDVAGDWLSDELKQTCMHIVEENALPVVFHPPASGEKKTELFGNADIFIFAPREPEGHP
ncbi:MAG: glycosyltransferase, partial [Bacteroidetes bacterium]|nr:glycosyltransferase [Bacteroidota bacterium]